jgi:hypothetical protein
MRNELLRAFESCVLMALWVLVHTTSTFSVTGSTAGKQASPVRSTRRRCHHGNRGTTDDEKRRNYG